MIHHGLDSGETTTFPHIVYSMPLRSTHIRMAFCPGTPKEESRNCLGFCSDLWLRWGLKQTCSFLQDFFKNVSHLTCTHQGRVDSWLFVVESQIASLTPDPSFCHNLCCRCPNGPCKPIFDIYTLLGFQQYKEHPNARCFDSCNQTLKFRESRRIPKSQFWECEFHPHIPSK